MMEHSKELNIDLNETDNKGRTALHYLIMIATPTDILELVQLFLDKYKDLGIDIKAVDRQGRNALDYARDRIDSLRFIENVSQMSLDISSNRLLKVKDMLTKAYSNFM